MKKSLLTLVLFLLLVGMVIPASAEPPTYNTWYLTSAGISTPVDVNAFAFSPNYTSDHVVYAGTNDGVYRSSDSGFNWTLIGTTGDVPVAHVESLAVSPDYANDKTIFAGTTSGVFMMADADVATDGTTWVNINGDISYSSILVIAFSPSDNALFAGTWGSGLFKTTDINGASTTWSPVGGFGSARITCIAFAPGYDANHTLFVGAITGDSNRGVYRSTNGGDSWSPVLNGMLDSDWLHRTVGALAVSPNYINDHTIFAGLTSSQGVFKSTNGGDTWNFLPETANVSVEAIAISPDYTDDGTVFAGGDDIYSVYVTTDAGTSWNAIYNGFDGRKAILALAIPPGQTQQPFNLFAGAYEVWQRLYQGSLKVFLPLTIR